MAVEPSARMTFCETEPVSAVSGGSAGRGRLLARLIGHRRCGAWTTPTDKGLGAAPATRHGGRSRPALGPPTERVRRRTAHGAVRSRRHRRAQPAAAWHLAAMVEQKGERTGEVPTCGAAQVLGDKFTSGTCPPPGELPVATSEGDSGFIARSGQHRQSNTWPVLQVRSNGN